MSSVIDIEEVYERYARRYLECGNPQQAAVDVGIPTDTVNEFLRNCTEHPAVIQILTDDELQMPDFNDPESVRGHILKKLWREANYKGNGAQQAARIAALKQIGEIVNIASVQKGDNVDGVEGGVMMIPVVDSSMWAAQSEEMQRKLKEVARE